MLGERARPTFRHPRIAASLRYILPTERPIIWASANLWRRHLERSFGCGPHARHLCCGLLSRTIHGAIDDATPAAAALAGVDPFPLAVVATRSHRGSRSGRSRLVAPRGRNDVGLGQVGRRLGPAAGLGTFF